MGGKGFSVGERWALFLFGSLLFSGALLLGWRTRKSDPRAATTLIVICLIPVILRAILILFPALEYRFLCHDSYAVLRQWWSIPFAIALFVTAAPHMSSHRARVGLIGLSCILWAFGTDRLLATARFEPHLMEGRVEEDGICRQTTNYTCGAAAAATLLHRYGVPATEREMAELCWTNALTGTDELCVARGLRRKLVDRPWLPKVQCAEWEDLLTLDRPAAVTIKYKLLVEHWVIILGIEKNRVLVGDPTSGRRVYSKEAFRKLWRGLMITLELKEPSLASSR